MRSMKACRAEAASGFRRGGGHARTAGLAALAMMLAATTGSQVGFAQQKVPMTPIGIPVAPTGLANRPLPKLPMEFDTARGSGSA